jgi:hypothetical protein
MAPEPLCKALVYLQLWIMEAPLFVVGFILVAFSILTLKKYYPVMKINGAFVFLSFVSTFILISSVVSGEVALSAMLLAALTFHGGVFCLIIYLGKHLTSRSRLSS